MWTEFLTLAPVGTFCPPIKTTKRPDEATVPVVLQYPRLPVDGSEGVASYQTKVCVKKKKKVKKRKEANSSSG